jgi:hypothetical protein
LLKQLTNNKVSIDTGDIRPAPAALPPTQLNLPSLPPKPSLVSKKLPSEQINYFRFQNRKNTSIDPNSIRYGIYEILRCNFKHNVVISRNEIYRSCEHKYSKPQMSTAIHGLIQINILFPKTDKEAQRVLDPENNIVAPPASAWTLNKEAMNKLVLTKSKARTVAEYLYIICDDIEDGICYRSSIEQDITDLLVKDFPNQIVKDDVSKQLSYLQQIGILVPVI